jgi:hypothetical protein
LSISSGVPRGAVRPFRERESYDLSGRGLYGVGQRDLAFQNYEISFKLDQGNDNAVAKLKQRSK